MKHITRLITILAFCAASLVALRAAPLTSETPVYASPDLAAPVLVVLGAGAEPNPATSASAVALPEGWQAIALTASIDVWVRDSDLNKDLDVKPGSALRTEPGDEADIVGIMVAGDVTELRGIQGKWVQMHVVKKVPGYINAPTTVSADVPTPTLADAPTPVPADVPTPTLADAPTSADTLTPVPADVPTPTLADVPTPADALPAAPTPTPAPEPAPPIDEPAQEQTLAILQDPVIPYATNQTLAPADEQPLFVSTQSEARPPASTPVPSPTQAPAPDVPAHPVAETQQTPPAPMDGGHTYEAGPIDSTAVVVSRTFEGIFALARRTFKSRRQYDFQLIAFDGSRLAYLDLSKIITTEKFENYIGRTVVVDGILAAAPNTQDAVIKVETLQAK
jgi:hypothetical protein